MIDKASKNALILNLIANLNMCFFSFMTFNKGKRHTDKRCVTRTSS